MLWYKIFENAISSYESFYLRAAIFSSILLPGLMLPTNKPSDLLSRAFDRFGFRLRTLNGYRLEFENRRYGLVLVSLSIVDRPERLREIERRKVNVHGPV